MDLSEINVTDKSNEGAWMDIYHPVSGELILDDKKQPMRIKLVGKHSDAFIKASRKIMDRRLSKQKGRAKVSITSEQLENESTETLARCVTDWNIIVDKERPECTFENVYAVLSDPRFRFLREQVDEFIEDDSNFT